MTPPFRDWSDLVLHTLKDRDYRLAIVDRGRDITVIAIHGGGIEPPTGELARAIAGDTWNLYELQGIRAHNNAELRVPPRRYKELRLEQLLWRSRVALGIDGVEDEKPCLQLDGANALLLQVLEVHLLDADLPACAVRAERDRGTYYNWARERGGVLGLPEALRRRFSPDSEDFGRLVQAVRAGLSDYQAIQRSDLDAALERFERTTRELRSRGLLSRPSGSAER